MFNNGAELTLCTGTAIGTVRRVDTALSDYVDYLAKAIGADPVSYTHLMLSVFIPAVSGVIMLLLEPNFMVPGVNAGLFLLVAVLLFLVNIL